MSHFKPAISLQTGGKSTRLKVDQTIPDSASGRAKWRVTTNRGRLPADVFTHAGKINEIASDGRGRVLTLIDIESGLTVAAIAYHIDRRQSAGVRLRFVAIPKDESDQGYDEAFGGVRILKEYLHAIAGKLFAGNPTIGYEPPSARARDEALNRLGFRRAAEPRAGRRRGVSYLEQD